MAAFPTASAPRSVRTRDTKHVAATITRLRAHRRLECDLSTSRIGRAIVTSALILGGVSEPRDAADPANPNRDGYVERDRGNVGWIGLLGLAGLGGLLRRDKPRAYATNPTTRPRLGLPRRV
jgi:hypothetical protein